MLLWTPAYGQSKAGRPARTFIQQLCDDTGCNPEDLPKAMNDWETWKERVRDIRASRTSWWWGSLVYFQRIMSYQKDNVGACQLIALAYLFKGTSTSYGLFYTKIWLSYKCFLLIFHKNSIATLTTLHEFKVLKKVFKTETFNVNFHNKFLKFFIFLKNFSSYCRLNFLIYFQMFDCSHDYSKV